MQSGKSSRDHGAVQIAQAGCKIRKRHRRAAQDAPLVDDGAVSARLTRFHRIPFQTVRAVFRHTA